MPSASSPSYAPNPRYPSCESERAAVISLRENEEIVVLLADKGNAPVVMDTEEYRTKILVLLGDAGTYASLEKDSTQKVQRELRKHLADVFHAVPSQHKGLYYKLICHNGSVPAIYGLPKLHKLGVPLRPIVDFTRSPLHRLSGFLHRVVSPLVGSSPAHLRNNDDFIEKVESLQLDVSDTMVSFDIHCLRAFPLIWLWTSALPHCVLTPGYRRDAPSRHTAYDGCCIFACPTRTSHSTRGSSS